MRWLKIYETFRSRGISSTLKFLNDNVGVAESKKFLNALKRFMQVVDYPINKISDNDLIYLRSEKAKFLKCEEEPQNPLGIYYIKFWFSIKEGFLGFTGTGKIDNMSIKRRQADFNSDTLKYIKENITPTGELYPVDDYSDLRTGDIVLGNFGSSLNVNKLSLATIFIDGYRVFVIQGVSDGNESDDPSWKKYNKYGGLSWGIANNYGFEQDHTHLYHWRNTPDELHIVDKLWDREEEVGDNPYKINIPLDGNFKFADWSGYYISRESFKKADFSIILKYDDMVNPDKAEYYELPSDIKKQRSELKIGATKLMSDSDIRDINIKRWIDKMSHDLDIVVDGEFVNLKKIISLDLLSEFSFFILEVGIVRVLGGYIGALYTMVDDNNLDILSRLKERYKEENKSKLIKLSQYRKYKSTIKSGLVKKIFDEIFKLGNEINSKFINSEVETIDDLYRINNQFSSLCSFIYLDRNRLNSHIRSIISYFGRNSLEDYYLDALEYYNEQDYKKDLVKIERIRSYLRSL